MNNERAVLEQFYAAINRNDMHGITTYFDPQIVRIEPESFPTAGTYRGIPEVQAHITARGTMHGGHPGGVSRRRRIALAERTDKRTPTR